jgi:hypothetical protein
MPQERCKAAAFFHESCFWKYPETKKLETLEEIVVLEDLPAMSRKQVLQSFQAFRVTDSKTSSTIVKSTPSTDYTPSADEELKLKEEENDRKQSKPRKRRKKDL